MRMNTMKGGGKGPVRAGNSNYRKRQISKALDPVLAGIDIRSLNGDHNLSRVHSTLIHRAHGVPTRRGTTTTIRQFLLGPSLDFANTPRGHSVLRQRTLIRDS